jgi:hypothetical protein
VTIGCDLNNDAPPDVVPEEETVDGTANETLVSVGYDLNNESPLNAAPASQGSVSADLTPRKLKCIHTNCQSSINKKSEIYDLIECENPMILALTEFGASSIIDNNELGIPGYSLYRGDHSSGEGGPGRGTALYIHDSLNHSACLAMERFRFDCMTWSQIKINNRDTLLFGVIYRSPNSPESNNDILMSILAAAKRTNSRYLCICGDFNLPLID